MRTLLVEGQGNFGSVDGDPPAAMRYTEARLAEPAMHLLADIRKNTVNFSPNFDGSLEEPDVLPAAIPNLLVNGATGIAVGMSTNIPPHNLGEVVDASVYMLENWNKLDDIDVEQLMHFIQGPDFPTGGLIIQGAEDEDLKAAYGAGRGRVTVQARAHLETMERGRSRIIVTELPYLTNKSSLIERIAELAREGKLEGLADLRDESDRQGLRIVIELTKSAEPESVLQNLYKMTPMRSTFGIIMLALVEGEPRMLSLKQALRVYLEHRLEVIRRRAEFDLERARQRAHILEGLLVALKYLDAVIDLIRRSPDADVARDRLMKKFKLSEIQAQAILDMPLRRLAALERKKIEEEYKELKVEIKNLETLLRSPAKMRQLASDELKAVKEAYGDRRRTKIAILRKGMNVGTPLLTASELVPQATVWISATADGLVSRSHDEKPPRFSGIMAPLWSVPASTRDILYLAAENGDTAAVFVHSLPEAETPPEGAPLHKVSSLPENTRLATLFTLPPREDRPEDAFIFTATRQGMVKRSAVAELPPPASHTFTLMKVNEEDRLGWARQTNGNAEILLATADGMAIRFKEDEVRAMGLVAGGVGGIKLSPRDEVAGMEVMPASGSILFVASDGKAKRVALDQFPVQGRNGQGVMAWKLSRTAQLVGTATGKPSSKVMLVLDKLAPKAMRMDEAPEQTRAAAGKPVVELRAGYQVLAVRTLQESAGVAPETTEKKRRFRAEAVPEEGAEPVQGSFDELLSGKPARKPAAKAKVKEPAPKAKTNAKLVRKTAAKPALKKTAAKTRQTAKDAKSLEIPLTKIAGKSPKNVADVSPTPSRNGRPKAQKDTTPKPAAGKKTAPKKSAPVKPAAKPANKTTTKTTSKPKQPAKPSAKKPTTKKVNK